MLGYLTFKTPFVIRAWKVQAYSLSPGCLGTSENQAGGGAGQRRVLLQLAFGQTPQGTERRYEGVDPSRGVDVALHG